MLPFNVASVKSCAELVDCRVARRGRVKNVGGACQFVVMVMVIAMTMVLVIVIVMKVGNLRWLRCCNTAISSCITILYRYTSR